jgi:hypothetical protein
MDKMDDNKGTPTKRTGAKNEASYDNDMRMEHGNVPEIEQPNPSKGTPSIPAEMPAREVR